jgi:hypothetical protein
MAKTIRGHSHVPAIQKGVYQVGTVSPTGRLDYNKGPVPWQTPGPKSWGGAMARMGMKDFFGESMCGDCISTKVTGGHDPRADKRRKCQLCGTVWPGLEPDNDRRGAILAQRTRTSEKNPLPEK